MFDKLAWQRKHRKENRKIHSGYHRAWRRERRKNVLMHLGGKCSNPARQWLNPDGSRGCTDWQCLQIDHVRGGGREDRRLYVASKGMSAFYKKVMLDKTGAYQLLCANCNWIKRYANEETGRHEQ